MSAKYAQRELKLIVIADDMLKKQSVISFKFSELAKNGQCSMGSLYRHFAGKEDVLLAVQTMRIEHLQQHVSLLFQAPLSPAEMWLALTLLPFWQAKDHGTELMVLSELPCIMTQASPARVTAFLAVLGSSCLNVDLLLKQAFSQGELSANDDEVSIIRTSVLCIQRGAMALSDTELCGTSTNALNAHKFARCLFYTINQLAWRRPLTSDSYNRIAKQLHQINADTFQSQRYIAL